MNSFNFIVSSTSTCGEKSVNKFWKDTPYFEKLREKIYKIQERF
ncbi:hypothetical protein [Spiroplasma endosymbiont of Virgichneumon dumeticola]